MFLPHFATPKKRSYGSFKGYFLKEKNGPYCHISRKKWIKKKRIIGVIF